MAAPTQIAIIDAAHHDGAVPGTGSYAARILDIGAGAGGAYTLAGVDVAAGALVVPIVPGSALVNATTLTVENIGEQPVITTDGDGDISITVGSGPYAGIYTTRHDGAPLTTAMVAAAPTCLRKPQVTGTTAAGDTLTITPGLWVYDGPDPGDQTWVQKVDGLTTGETDLDYVIQPADAGKTFTVEEMFGGVTVTGAAVEIQPAA